jgi:hypothetical protein
VKKGRVLLRKIGNTDSITFPLGVSRPSPAAGEKITKGDTPLVSPAKRDFTPLDSPKGEDGVITVAGDIEK